MLQEINAANGKIQSVVHLCVDVLLSLAFIPRLVLRAGKRTCAFLGEQFESV